MLSEISQSQKDSTVPFHFYELPTVVRFIDRDSRMVVARVWWKGKRMKSYYLMDAEFQLHKMKRFLEMDGGDG